MRSNSTQACNFTCRNHKFNSREQKKQNNSEATSKAQSCHWGEPKRPRSSEFFQLTTEEQLDRTHATKLRLTVTNALTSPKARCRLWMTARGRVFLSPQQPPMRDLNPSRHVSIFTKILRNRPTANHSGRLGQNVSLKRERLSCVWSLFRARKLKQSF